MLDFSSSTPLSKFIAGVQSCVWTNEWKTQPISFSIVILPFSDFPSSQVSRSRSTSPGCGTALTPLCDVSCWLYFYIYLPTTTSPEEHCEPGPWDRQWGMVTISANTCWAPALCWDDWDKMWDLEPGVMHSVWGFLTPLLSGLRQLHLPVEAHLLICKMGIIPGEVL